MRNRLRPSAWARGWQALRLQQPLSLVYDSLVTLCFAVLISSLLHPALLSAGTLPTGGDTASQMFYAKIFQEEMLGSWRITGWMPEVFAGFPLMSYYFPLPFIAAAGLGHLLGFEAGLKWAIVLPSLLLPGTVFALSRHMLRLPSIAAWAAALSSVAFLLHEQNAIWGGNLLSVLAGEFAYSWGMWAAFAGMAAWWRAARHPERPGAWVLPTVLEALTGLCHGYPLLWLGSASFLLVLSGQPKRQVIVLLLKGHLAAFALLGGWLWPLLEIHAYTIPNDAATPLHTWADALPPALWPVLGAGVLGVCSLVFRRLRVRHLCSARCNDSHAVASDAELGLLCFGALASAWAVCASMGAERVGLLDVRFLPLAWLMGAVVCGWLFGLALGPAGTPASRFFLGFTLLCGLMLWLGPRVREVPTWAYWNHSGLQVKPQWQVLSQLLPDMAGKLDSPRLLFEHDPLNEDLGSTRVLEALPMFLGGRPVLEGLYMESALLGPVVYQLQAEVSVRPSSPLVRFPSGQLDPDMAAVHMQMLNVSQVLLRSQGAAAALMRSGHFEKEATAGPFTLLRLKGFVNALVDPTPRRWAQRPREGWMLDSYRWFRSARLMQEGWPVYESGRGSYRDDDVRLYGPPPDQAVIGTDPSKTAQIEGLALTRHTLEFNTHHVGRPHLVKMAYHPRWELMTRGTLELAAPGFMLVTPEEAQVRLRYGTTWVGRMGEAASLLAIGAVIWSVMRGARHRRRITNNLTVEFMTSGTAQASRQFAGWGVGAGLIAVLTLVLQTSSPGIAYHRAWSAFRQGQHDKASVFFFSAYENRRSSAGQEEALFWSAKSADAAGNSGLALDRYQKLANDYHGHWIAESLSEIARLARQRGDASTAESAQRRLVEEYPKSRWAAPPAGEDLSPQ